MSRTLCMPKSDLHVGGQGRLHISLSVIGLQQWQRLILPNKCLTNLSTKYSFSNIFQNILMPLSQTYLGSPRNIVPRINRRCFQHPPEKMLAGFCVQLKPNFYSTVSFNTFWGNCKCFIRTVLLLNNKLHFFHCTFNPFLAQVDNQQELLLDQKT